MSLRSYLKVRHRMEMRTICFYLTALRTDSSILTKFPAASLDTFFFFIHDLIGSESFTESHWRKKDSIAGDKESHLEKRKRKKEINISGCSFGSHNNATVSRAVPPGSLNRPAYLVKGSFVLFLFLSFSRTALLLYPFSTAL